MWTRDRRNLSEHRYQWGISYDVDGFKSELWLQSLDAADELNVGAEESLERIDKRTRGVRRRIRPNGFGLVRNAGRASISCERLLERAKRFARFRSRVVKRTDLGIALCLSAKNVKRITSASTSLN
jgi:hypothetical protein